jgi:hypothetical protein
MRVSCHGFFAALGREAEVGGLRDGQGLGGTQGGGGGGATDDTVSLVGCLVLAALFCERFLGGLCFA